MRLLAIQWMDARGTRPDWGLVEDIDDGLCMISSVGWVIHETDEYIQLAPHIGHDPKQACGDMIIPKAGIVKQHKFKLKGWQS